MNWVEHMSTSVDFIAYVAEQLAHTGTVRTKKMFGEYMVYINEKPLVIVCDSTPMVKKLPCLDGLLTETGFPYAGAKEHYILDVDDKERTEQVIAALDAVTPFPKPKQPKKTKQ
jgi:hypothetical protein